MRASTANGHCQAVTRTGEPCGAFAVSGSVFCFAHAPERTDERAAARSKGGRARHGRELVTADAGFSLSTVADVARVLGVAVADTLRLENSVARSRCLGYLVAVALRAVEVGDLERRIAALEEQLLQGGGIYEQ